MKSNKLTKEEKLANERTNNTVYCKCGHSIVMYPFERKAEKICRWCGNLVFRDKKAEFEYKLKTTMIRMKKEQRDERV